MWKGDPDLPLNQQGIKILGVPNSIHGQSHAELLEKIPFLKDLQCVWLILHFFIHGVSPDCSLQFATRHEAQIWPCHSGRRAARVSFRIRQGRCLFVFVFGRIGVPQQGAFYLGQFYSGQVHFRPTLACPFDHPKCQDKKKKNQKGREKETKGRDNQYGLCFCDGVAGRRAPSRLMSAFRVSTGLHVEHRRPSAGDAPHEGLLKSKGGGLGL